MLTCMSCRNPTFLKKQERNAHLHVVPQSNFCKKVGAERSLACLAAIQLFLKKSRRGMITSMTYSKTTLGKSKQLQHDSKSCSTGY